MTFNNFSFPYLNDFLYFSWWGIINNLKNKTMETVILVSVLSTIGVVAVLLSVAVAFIKLRSKVDVSEIRDIYQRIDEVQRENV